MYTLKQFKVSLFNIIFLALFSSTVFAMDLSEAKDAGLIGEQANGYLGLVSKPASEQVKNLVKQVNTKRKTKYLEIAAENGIDLKVVEKQAGDQVIEKTVPGNYINTGSGWTKK